MAKIGFIGLGIMGRPMVKNLIKAGHQVTAYDIVPAGLDDVAAAGAERGSSPKDVASRTDVIITMVPDGPEVEQAILGPNGVLEGARKGSTVVDMSSISPMVAQKVGAALEAKGVDFLDAPVSGGEPKAIDGTLAIMVGGKQDVFDKMEPILKNMGATVTLTGKVGAGNVTKLANQIMVAVNIAAMGEALALATKAGLDPEVVFNAVKAGLAGSTVLNVKAPMVYSPQLQAGLPHPAPSERSPERAARRRVAQSVAAADEHGAEHADRPDEQRQRRSRSFGHRADHRGSLGRRSQEAFLGSSRVLSRRQFRWRRGDSRDRAAAFFGDSATTLLVRPLLVQPSAACTESEVRLCELTIPVPL